MREIPVWESGDGLARADAGCKIHSSADKTAAYTVKDYEVGKCFTNRGASGAVTFTLPVPKAGVWFSFAKVVPAQNIVLQMPAAVKINNGTVAKAYQNVTDETAAAGLATCIVVGISSTEYIIWSEKGTWANNNS